MSQSQIMCSTSGHSTSDKYDQEKLVVLVVVVVLTLKVIVKTSHFLCKLDNENYI